MPRVNEPVVLTLSPAVRAGAVVAALLLVGMLAVLIGVLVSLESTRSEIRTTRAGVLAADHRSARVSGELEPLLDAAAPLAGEQGRHALDRAAARAGQGLDAVSSIAATLDRAQLGGTLTSIRALTQAALTATQPASRSLAACDTRLRDSPPTAPGQVACMLRAVPNIRALLRSQRRLNRRSVATQVLQLSVLRRSYDQLAQSLAIQREILQHARSLDAKTGGSAPAAPVGRLTNP